MNPGLLVLLSVAGGVGAVLRFVVDGLVRDRVGARLPWGTAVINVTWSHDMFELDYKYTSHASHSETYQVDPASGALTVTEQITDPIVGKIVVRSVYRRGAPGKN